MASIIQHIIEGRKGNIGIPVKRLLPVRQKRMVGPFIFLDQMGPVILKAPDEHMDVRPHPHIGLSTLTYLFEGQIYHRDSLGTEQLIEPGEVNWMTAGKGISHSERDPVGADKVDRPLHGLQFWVALPVEHEDTEPSFMHYDRSAFPEVALPSLQLKVIAGSYEDQASKLATYSPTTFLVAHAKSAGAFSLNQIKGHEHAIYIVKGSVTLADETFTEGKLLVLEPEQRIELTHSADALFVVIGGEVFPEPRYIWWNLVSSSPEKIEAAREAWINKTFPQVPNDPDYIPAPEYMKIVNYP